MADYVASKGQDKCQCKNCNSFLSGQELLVHTDLHRVVMKDKCQFCDRLLGKYSLKKHLQSVHDFVAPSDDTEQGMASVLHVSFACQFCRREYDEQFDKDEHELTCVKQVKGLVKRGSRHNPKDPQGALKMSKTS